MFLTKQLLRRDLQRTTNDVIDALGVGGVNSLIELAIKLGPIVPSEGQDYPDKFVDWICAQSLSGEQDYFVVQGQKALKRMVVDESLRSEVAIKEMSTLMSYLTVPQVDFSGTKIPGESEDRTFDRGDIRLYPTISRPLCPSEVAR